MGAATIEKLDEVWMKQHNFRWIEQTCRFCRHVNPENYGDCLLCKHPTRISNRDADTTTYDFYVSKENVCDLWEE